MVIDACHEERADQRPRLPVRRAFTLGVAGLLTAAGVLTLAGTASAASTLGGAAAAKGRYFGAAVAANHLGEGQYAATLDTEFNAVTPENEMKWESVEGSRNSFNFGAADQIVSHAQGKSMKIRGHTLVWHSQLPGWVGGLGATDLRSAMNNHITKVMQHYQGKIYAWDVVNEAFQDGGSGARRSSPFQDKLGDGFIEEAFRTARAADPNAKLCYNDYNTDGQNAKSNAVYAMVKDFKARGVPIDCVGFQSHFNSQSPVPGDYQQNLQRFADLGVDVQITELDIEGSGSAQADSYRRVTQACLAVSRCTGITVWGIPDKYSWRASGTPLLFDDNYGKKPAYDAVLAALGGSGGGDGGGGRSCTVSYAETQRWGDRFNGQVTVRAGSSAISGWTVTVTLRSAQTVSATWNGSPSWDSSGKVMTMKPNGNGNLGAGASTSFGFTVMANGDWSAPTIGSCTAS
ncbi:beta-xylanase [Streptomyces hygroscopicus subsp. sporocinereus]|uniref:Beta-xylanase n=1 Tax=Streptomyces hygroscopicus TaxID=1912 RepID=A0ABQ3UAX9_STRHY|nr:endo-1,4-beta-xylanase [Streptomyces hygroscopicus]GHJ32762.1 beta-xylanase [Streptomyces hygroscopicus]